MPEKWDLERQRAFKKGGRRGEGALKANNGRNCLAIGFDLAQALFGSQYHLDRIIRGEATPREKDRALWDTKVIKNKLRKAEECGVDLTEFESRVDEAMRFIEDGEYQRASSAVRDMELKIETKLWEP